MSQLQVMKHVHNTCICHLVLGNFGYFTIKLLFLLAWRRVVAILAKCTARSAQSSVASLSSQHTSTQWVAPCHCHQPVISFVVRPPPKKKNLLFLVPVHILPETSHPHFFLSITTWCYLYFWWFITCAISVAIAETCVSIATPRGHSMVAPHDCVLPTVTASSARKLLTWEFITTSKKEKTLHKKNPLHYHVLFDKPPGRETKDFFLGGGLLMFR